MSVKPGGLLAKTLNKHESQVCSTCEHLVTVGNALGCAAHDKLILPDYPPYHGNMMCGDWKGVGGV